MNAKITISIDGKTQIHYSKKNIQNYLMKVIPKTYNS